MKSNIINSYNFGSRIYETFNINPDKPSDFDFILVVKKYVESRDLNTHIFTVEQFQSHLDDHDIQMLECYFSSDHFKSENHKFNFKLDLGKLRKSISTVVSHSWVKGKKKITVMADYDVWLGIKSLFHSLRILDFGIQIAEHGKIVNFKSMNYILEDLIKISKQYQHNELWEIIDSKYRSLYNSMNSKFKSLAPKDLTEKDRERTLINIFEKHNIDFGPDIINEILTIL